MLLLLAAATLVLLPLGLPRAASAHAELLGTTPADGAVVAHVRAVALRFDEPVTARPDSIRVTGPGGARAPVGTVRTVGPTVRASVLARTAGTYAVTWRVVSDDGHPVAGTFSFSVRHATVPVTARPAAGASLPAAYAVVRWLGYAGFCALAGGAVFLLLCWPAAGALRRIEVLVGGGALVAWSATWATLFVQGAYDDGTWAHLAAPDTIVATLESRTGAATMTRLVLLLVLAVLAVAALRWSMLLRGADRRRLLAGTVVTAVLTAGTWSVTGHPSVGGGWPVAVAADALHLTAVALWLGGLLLLVAARGAPLRAASTFSRMALPCVLVIAITGAYQAQRELPSWSALVGTGYGRLVLGKVTGLILLAACGQLARRMLARRMLTRRMLAGDADAVTAPARLHVLVMLEVVVAAAVLGVAAVLVQTPPR